MNKPLYQGTGGHNYIQDEENEVIQTLEEIKVKAREEFNRRWDVGEFNWGGIEGNDINPTRIFNVFCDTLIEQVWNARTEKMKEALKANIPDGENVKVNGHRLNESGVGGWNQLRYSLLQNLDYFLTPKISKD